MAAIKPEFALPYMLALVAHHPDMSLRAEDLQLCGRYLDFYLESVLEAANLDFLYHVAAVAKTHEDAVDPAMSKVRLRGARPWACAHPMPAGSG